MADHSTPERTCEDCSGPLSVYNDGVRCAPCQRRFGALGQALPAVPAEVWDARDIREALAGWDLGAVARLVRERTGLRQDAVAELTDLSQGFLSQLESGDRKLVDIRKIISFLDGLGTPTGLLPRPSRRWRRNDRPGPHVFAARQHETDPGLADPPVTESETDDPLDRRNFLAHIAAVTVGAADLAGSWASHTPSPTPLPGRIGQSDVENVEATTQALRGLDYAIGGGGCRDAIEAHLRWAQQLAKAPATSTVRERLVVAIADLHNLAGWTAFDIGLWDPARRHLLAALGLAKQAEDHSLAANVLYRTGRVHLHHGWATEALRLFQLGQIAARDSGSLLSTAVLSANEAWAYAALGRASQALAALRRAEEAFAADGHVDRPGWVRFFGRADLAAMAGTVHTELAADDPAHADAAIAALADSLSQRGDDMSRSRAFELAMLATNHLRHGDPDNGAALAEAAVDGAAQLRSARVIDRLAPLQAAIGGHPQRADLRHVGQRIAALA